MVWEPQSFSAAFILSVISMVCWGSWSNSTKAAANVPFPVFYLDYSLGTFLCAFVAFLSPLNDALIAVDDATPVEFVHFISAVAAGVLFNIANVLLVLGIQVAGLAVAFPVGVGTALVLGTLFTYFIDPRGEPTLLFTGVALGFVAILCQVAANAAHSAKRQQRTAPAAKETRELEAAEAEIPEAEALTPVEGPLHERLLQKRDCCENERPSGLLMCCLSGILLSLWSPLSAISMRAMRAESSFSVYTGSIVLSSLFICPLLSVRPIVGQRIEFTEFTRVKAGHGWGLLGGFVWATGTLSNLLSGETLGPALSYALGQAAPMVATAWGLFYYHEFDGCPLASKLWIAGMFTFYAAAITCIAYSKSES